MFMVNLMFTLFSQNNAMASEQVELNPVVQESIQGVGEQAEAVINKQFKVIKEENETLKSEMQKQIDEKTKILETQQNPNIEEKKPGDGEEVEE